MIYFPSERVTGYDGYMPLTLHHPDGQVFSFDAGALCLELACGTGGEGFRARFETLHTPDDVSAWARESRFDAPVAVTDEDLRALKDLREAVWAAAYAVATGDEPPAGAIGSINAYAAGPAPVPVLDAATATAGWRSPVTGPELVTAVARDAVATFARPLRDRVRTCGGDRCLLTYLDTSRSGGRRWCSMQRCGNRHKVRAFRAREAAA
jgi:predicted RNA-binding Zn ribbon-like protein